VFGSSLLWGAIFLVYSLLESTYIASHDEILPEFPVRCPREGGSLQAVPSAQAGFEKEDVDAHQGKLQKENRDQLRRTRGAMY